MTKNEPTVTKRDRAHGRGASRPATVRLRAKASELGHDIQEFGEIAKDVAHEQVGHLRENASQFYQRGQGKVEEMERTIEEYVQEQPIKSLLIAAAAGMLLGGIWMRR